MSETFENNRNTIAESSPSSTTEHSEMIASAREDAIKLESKAKKWVTIVAVIVVVVAIFVGITSISSGYKASAKKVMKAFIKNDVETIMTLSSGMYDEELLGYFYEAGISEKIEDSMDQFANTCGANFKMSYEITDDYTLSEADVEEIRSDYYYVDFDVTTISDIAMVVVELTGKGNGEKATQTVKLMMTKESGSWKLFAMSVSY
ncbi:MAG: hypothetical protein LUH18_05955 [Oscillospiraceae bacterium]|nr:hypothetical protein [Oscillospiraceae bacterium]